MQFFQSIAGLLCIAVMQSYFNGLVSDLTPAPIAEQVAAVLPFAALVSPSGSPGTAAWFGELTSLASAGCAKGAFSAANAAALCATLDSAKTAVTFAYSTAVTHSFYISIAGAVAGLVTSCFMRWIPLSAGNDDGGNAAAKAPAADAPAPAPATAAAG